MTIKCPNKCKEIDIERWPDADTPHSTAYVCCACGITFHITKIQPRSVERELWKEKYGENE